MVKWCRSVLPERRWGGVRHVKGESGKKRWDTGLESSDHKPTLQPASPAAGPSHRREDPTGPTTGDGQQNLTTGQWVLLEGGQWGTSAHLVFIKRTWERTWMQPGLLCLWVHLREQRPWLTFTISVSPQILLAGGRGDCAASRACSPTTTWPRSEARRDSDARDEGAAGTHGSGRVGAPSWPMASSCFCEAWSSSAPCPWRTSQSWVGDRECHSTGAQEGKTGTH